MIDSEHDIIIPEAQFNDLRNWYPEEGNPFYNNPYLEEIKTASAKTSTVFRIAYGTQTDAQEYNRLSQQLDPKDKTKITGFTLMNFRPDYLARLLLMKPTKTQPYLYELREPEEYDISHLRMIAQFIIPTLFTKDKNFVLLRTLAAFYDQLEELKRKGKLTAEQITEIKNGIL